MSDLINKLIRPAVQALHAYDVPDSGNAIKLDAMENPWPWPGELQAEWFAALSGVEINRYPDADATPLRMALREWMGLDELKNAAELDLMLGNGSDELIQILAMAVQGQGDKPAVILAPEPGFVMYKMIATYVAAEYVGVPLQQDFSLDMTAMLAAITLHQPAIVYLAYPNNPTGNQWSRQDVETIIKAAPGLVIADEAYAPFADDSMVSGLERYDNLLVMRTLSKVGLAGLRLGMLAGRKGWIEQLNKLRMPYNINQLTQRSALFALANRHVLDQQAVSLCQLRAELHSALERIVGVTPWPSQANFILCQMPQGKATEIHQTLLSRGVLVKKVDGSHPLLADCLRVTVGSGEQNKEFLSALEAAVAAS